MTTRHLHLAPVSGKRGPHAASIVSAGKIRELASKGQTRREVAEALGASVPAVARIARKFDIAFGHELAIRQSRDPAIIQRADTMATLFRAGYTLQQIGGQYGITRERARQIITKHAGLRGNGGGARVKADRNRAAREESFNAKINGRYGCSADEWREMRRVAAEMRDQGISIYRTPLGAYRSQQANAATRGIGWELSLWQWWQVWQRSGKWERRGRGQGYVMCRIGDVGPYALGNVFIDLAVNNCSEKPSKKSGLPIGVSNRRGVFVAKRMIGGVGLHLGTFPTAELAHAAYLSAGIPLHRTTKHVSAEQQATQ